MTGSEGTQVEFAAATSASLDGVSGREERTPSFRPKWTSTPALRHRERHQSGRAGWLRAAVLGSDDAIASTASLVERARAASCRLINGEAAAAVSANLGFSDQAHMTRELGSSFGFTPARFRKDPLLAELFKNAEAEAGTMRQ